MVGGRLYADAVLPELHVEEARATAQNLELCHATVVIGQFRAVTVQIVGVKRLVYRLEMGKRLLKGEIRAAGAFVCHVAVHPLIRLGALGPGEVLRHAASLYFTEHLFVTKIQLYRLLDGQIERLGLVVGEGEAVTDAVKVTVRPDGILQTAGLMDDGHRAVAHGHHLAEAAGLEAGGHQIHICAGKHLAGHLLGVVAGKAQLPRPLLPGPVEEVDVLLLALAENDELDAHLHELGQDLPDEFDALLLHQPRYRAQQRPGRLLRQAEFLLDGRLAFCLAGAALHGKVVGNARINGGVIVGHIDAVENAVGLALHHVHDLFQPVAKVRVMQFPGVCGGYGGHGVRHQNSALHQIDVVAALVFIAQTALIPSAGQGKGALHLIGAKLALVGNVVDGKDRLDAPEILAPRLIVLEIQHRRRRLPVVAVKDPGPEVQIRQQVDNRTAEKSKPPAVILIAVEPRAVKKVVIGNEPHGHTVPVAAVEAAGGLPVAQDHRGRGHKLQLPTEPLTHAPVQRRDDGDVISRRLQGGRQGKSHVSQSAGLAEGRALAGDKQDLHTAHSFPVVFPRWDVFSLHCDTK